MKNIELQWKEFNVDAEAFKASVDTLVPGKCVGVSANSKLEVHCDDSTTDEEVQAIQDLWAAVTEESEEATSYRSKGQIADAIKAMKAAVPAKTWAQMSAIERGLLIGQEPTKAQLIEAGLL